MLLKMPFLQRSFNNRFIIFQVAYSTYVYIVCVCCLCICDVDVNVQCFIIIIIIFVSYASI